MGRYTVVITGASGSVYGLRLVEQLLLGDHEVVLCMTEAGRDVTAFETEFELPAEEPAREVLRFLELPQDSKLRNACPADLFDPIASGSNRLDGMIVVPASMGFCAKVASGIAADLPSRAADVCLKERIPLVFVPRETPLSLVHLRNLTSLTEAGAIIVPAMPSFYHHPEGIDDLINQIAGKVLDILGIDNELSPRWGD